MVGAAVGVGLTWQPDVAGQDPAPPSLVARDGGSGAKDPGGVSAAGLDRPDLGRGGGRAATGRVVEAAAVLRSWDRRRAEAYRRGDVPLLHSLYVGRAATSDVRLLRSWTARGYRVTGMRTQLLAVDVLGHRPGTWTLRVVDRLTGAVAVRAGERLTLPRDRADEHVVRLVRGADGGWRVAWVSARAPRR